MPRMEVNAPISRRRVLGWLGGLGLAALVPGCADEGDSTSATTGTAATAGAAEQEACMLSPELTEGPYYLDLDKVRRDITEGRPGTPLELRVNVVDGDGCAPIRDAAVDVWHCDAGGDYSGVEGDSGTFLRGIKMTDDEGAAEFRTIYPGWYTGRAVHIHVKVHLAADETYTGQLFFDEGVTNEVSETAPYSDRGAPDVPNSADGIYAQGGSATVVAVTPSADGYAGVVTLGVQRA
jgi:protocatechuate 3,4-dioxygenase beta subunit